MLDPDEGVDADGMIITGARRSRVSPVFEPVLAAVVAELSGPGVSVWAYGSVVTGQAVPDRSDVDLVVHGVPASWAAAVGTELSRRFADRCRGVEIGAGAAADLVGDGDEAYGNRVFLRHYAVLLAGPGVDLPRYPADVRAARGFNGDLARHRDRWRASPRTPELGRRIARKTLLAVAGLVSVHDGTWTTDRVSAAARWGGLHPELASGLTEFVSWIDEPAGPGEALELVEVIVAQFEAQIGLWSPA